MDTIDIDISKILAAIPQLESLSGVCQEKEGWFLGSTFRVSWDGKWTASPREISGASTLGAIPSGCIVLQTSQGELKLRKPLVTRNMPDGSTEGVAASSSLRRNGTEQATPTIFRTYVKTTNALDKVSFPALIRDKKMCARARIPLQIDGRSVELIWLNEGPFLILESAAPGMDEQEFSRLSIGLRQFFSYLLGERLDGDRCDVQLDASGAVIQVDWYEGKNSKRNIYHPIPVSWSEWGAATAALNLSIADGPLLPDMLSRMASAFLRNADLVTPVEYLLQFPDAPLEMRGALLSVALESLTAVLVEQNVLMHSKLPPDKEWDTFLGALTALVNQYTTWTQQRRAAILDRVRKSNLPSNNEKLTAPFKALGIKLTKEDRKAIYRRNQLLHEGRILTSDEVRNDPEAWREAYEVEMRIYTAVNRLLLTYLGYKGVIVDWGRTSADSVSLVYGSLPAEPSDDDQQIGTAR
ncbi:hypothetical protein [Stigmatella erecta]|uniref:ApeA N-terminal domain-containing protein n=1 Tax=Stigmatella erecta TaxID=83460 RepID=A0A1I0I866_9BACT|nr:hypothetical protein [Stigmatella erecta]SET92821.1 hypothetical protein SAMN05443639_105364 [Stigmatella erecta]